MLGAVRPCKSPEHQVTYAFHRFKKIWRCCVIPDASAFSTHQCVSLPGLQFDRKQRQSMPGLRIGSADEFVGDFESFRQRDGIAISFFAGTCRGFEPCRFGFGCLGLYCARSAGVSLVNARHSRLGQGILGRKSVSGAMESSLFQAAVSDHRLKLLRGKRMREDRGLLRFIMKNGRLRPEPH